MSGVPPVCPVPGSEVLSVQGDSSPAKTPQQQQQQQQPWPVSLHSPLHHSLRRLETLSQQAGRLVLLLRDKPHLLASKLPVRHLHWPALSPSCCARVPQQDESSLGRLLMPVLFLPCLFANLFLMPVPSPLPCTGALCPCGCAVGVRSAGPQPRGAPGAHAEELVRDPPHPRRLAPRLPSCPRPRAPLFPLTPPPLPRSASPLPRTPRYAPLTPSPSLSFVPLKHPLSSLCLSLTLYPGYRVAARRAMGLNLVMLCSFLETTYVVTRMGYEGYSDTCEFRGLE